MEAAIVACMADWEASLSLRGLCRYIDVCVLRGRNEVKCICVCVCAFMSVCEFCILCFLCVFLTYRNKEGERMYNLKTLNHLCLQAQACPLQ